MFLIVYLLVYNISKLRSFRSKMLDGNQSIYKQIVDHFEDLQQFHQKLTRTSESGVHQDFKTFKSKQKGIFILFTHLGSRPHSNDRSTI